MSGKKNPKGAAMSPAERIRIHLKKEYGYMSKNINIDVLLSDYKRAITLLKSVLDDFKVKNFMEIEDFLTKQGEKNNEILD